jgi:hypothetical protein
MRPTDPKVTLSGTKLRETDKAVQFSVHSISGRKLDCPPIVSWFPFSQTEKSYTCPDDSGEDWIIVSEWIVKQKKELAQYLDLSDPAPVGSYVVPTPTKRTQKPFDDYDEWDIPF